MMCFIPSNDIVEPLVRGNEWLCGRYIIVLQQFMSISIRNRQFNLTCPCIERASDNPAACDLNALSRYFSCCSDPSAIHFSSNSSSVNNLVTLRDNPSCDAQVNHRALTISRKTFLSVSLANSDSGRPRWRSIGRGWDGSNRRAQILCHFNPLLDLGLGIWAVSMVLLPIVSQVALWKA